ncbi:MAG TPA: Rieske 2Fe-2S domain-containing protein [Sporichthya sp.]|nr:Rieske 2Fe-2S domain-containing protein [Sporichthya sp.]
MSAPAPTPDAALEATPGATPKGAKTPKPAKSPSAAATTKPAKSPAASPKATPKPAKPAAGGGGKPVGPSFADASAVPVGSGALFESDEIIVTQPTAGKYLGWSDLCTHEGCIIDVFQGKEMICTCHDSHFDIATGKPVAGPAKKVLPSKPIVVKDGKIYKAS